MNKELNKFAYLYLKTVERLSEKNEKAKELLKNIHEELGYNDSSGDYTQEQIEKMAEKLKKEAMQNILKRAEYSPSEKSIADNVYEGFEHVIKKCKNCVPSEKSIVDNVFDGLAYIIEKCKNNAFFTLVLMCTLYSFIFAIKITVGRVDIEQIHGGYYPSFIICKWLFFITSGIITYRIFKKNRQSNAILLFGGIAIIFNTIIKIPFNEEQWIWAILISTIIFIVYTVKQLKIKGE